MPPDRGQRSRIGEPAVAGAGAGDHAAEAPVITLERTPPKPIIAGAVGNMMEWYDFSVYAYLATVIAAVFFPEQAAGLLLTFATFGVGFLMRPLGAITLGYFGDRIGRRNTLAFTIILMAVATFAIGIIPGYATIGILAPILLVVFRLLQGFSAGGEWGGSTSFMVEYARRDQRGFIGSWQQFSIVVALILGSATSALVTNVMSEESLHAWGWRLPFLIGGVLGLIGLYLRLRVEDTPKFRELEIEHEVSQAPLRELVREHWVDMFRALGFTLVWTVAFYIFLSYMPTYLAEEAGFSLSFGLIAVTIGLAFFAFLIPFMGLLSDRVGRKPLLLASCALFAVMTYPLFLLLGTGSQVAAIAVTLALAVPLSFFSGPGPAALAELFPTRVRYSALSIPYNLAVAIFGGFAPFIATLLIRTTGSNLSPTFYVIAAAIISFLTISTFRETAREPLK